MNVLPSDAPAAVEAVVDALERGHPVVVPTDTVYGVAVTLEHPDAAAALAAAKGRSADQPVAVLVADRGQAEAVGDLTGSADPLVTEFWPGPLTVVVPRVEGGGWSLGEPSTTVGLRHPAARFVVDVARRVGPLAVTSANAHGRPPPRHARQAARALRGSVEVIVDGGLLSAPASTVVDLVARPPRLLREGTIDRAALAAVVPGWAEP